ncbi:hypothetical protein SAMN05216326_1764 [Nitrosomonas marina]|uniref:Uncharacterized protein n=1 Tax=Nitrosomonas marina TaxID=917 RepID=A0A1I0GJU1_9PROT|nr:hypothetical protein [Nitrosomonas marina]SET70420.1 hypothetical protein SAMN05216326_1764 [Nitrosomonas marina]
MFDKTIQQHVQTDQNISEIPCAQRRTQAWPLSYYSSLSNRNERISAAYQTGSYTMKAIVDEFGLHYETVNRVVEIIKHDLNNLVAFMDRIMTSSINLYPTATVFRKSIADSWFINLALTCKALVVCGCKT